MRKVSELVIIARKTKGIRQSDLGNLVGLSTVSIGSIETGRHSASIERLQSIAIALDIPLDDMLAAIIQDIGKDVTDEWNKLKGE